MTFLYALPFLVIVLAGLWCALSETDEYAPPAVDPGYRDSRIGQRMRNKAAVERGEVCR